MGNGGENEYKGRICKRELTAKRGDSTATKLDKAFRNTSISLSPDGIETHIVNAIDGQASHRIDFSPTSLFTLDS